MNFSNMAGVIIVVTALSGCSSNPVKIAAPPQNDAVLEALTQEGIAEIDAGAVEEGILKLKRVFAQNNQSLEALNGLARGHAIKGDLGVARVFSSLAMDINPERAIDVNQLAELESKNNPGSRTSPHLRLAGLTLYNYRLNNVVIEQPQLAASSIGSAKGSAEPVEIILANGNGEAGNAASWRERLDARGIKIRAIRNAENFNHLHTSIVFPPRQQQAAEGLQREMGLEARMVEHDVENGMILVVLGRDAG